MQQGSLKQIQPSVFARERQYDPTRTLTLRRQFSAQMTRRFRALKGLINQAVVAEDVFGLREGPVLLAELSTPGPKMFEFRRNSEKVDLFMEWLDEQERRGVLEVIDVPGALGLGVEDPWTNKFVQSAYQRGIARARVELLAHGYDVPDLEVEGGLSATFNRPFHVERVGLAYTRTFNELKGITDAMDQQISRVLAEGLAEGRHPREIARAINDRVDKVGLTRARTLARTEVIRAHHSAMVEEYRSWAVEDVVVRAEWVTAGDSRVCRICAPLDGKEFSLDEIGPMIPRHPNCRCISIPVDQEEV